MARFTFDPRFIEIEAELWALGQFLPVIEAQIEYLIAQDRVRMEADLAEQGLLWEDPDVQSAFQDHYARANRVFPRFMRAPFIVALCACYETSIEELASAIAEANERSLQLKDIRGSTWPDSARKYFQSVLGIPIDEDAGRVEFISDLFLVRNAIAHANGDTRGMPDSKLARLRQVIQRYPGLISIDDSLVVLDPAFLKLAFSNVNDSVRALVEYARGGPSFRFISRGS